MKLSRDDVAKIAQLARLEFAPKDLDSFAEQMSAILDYVEKLGELDTDNVAPTTSSLSSGTPERVDEPVVNHAREIILEHSPDHEGPLFKVPKVI